MKKLLPLFIGCAVMSQNAAMAAITITKAKPVATKQTSSVEAGASLLPTVMNLVGGIKQLSQQQKALTDECIPTSSEITFVNNTIKEWAKTGAKTAEEVEVALGMRPCGPGDSYEFTVRMAEGADERDLICYDTYDASSADGMVWLGYPIAVSTYYCTDGSLSGCSNKNKKYVSNIYDIFNLIDFVEADYTAQEAKMASTLISKIENCSYAKISAKQRALWGDFLVSTMGNLGQKTNTGTILQTVSGVANSGGSGALQSLGSIATQFLQ